MGLFNSMKQRLGFGDEEGYDEDDYGEEEYTEEEGYEETSDYPDAPAPAARDYQSRSSRDETSIRVVPRVSSSDDAARRSRYGASSYGSTSYGTAETPSRQSSYDTRGAQDRTRRASSVSEPEFMKNRPTQDNVIRGVASLDDARGHRGNKDTYEDFLANSPVREPRMALSVLTPASYADAEQIVTAYKSQNNVVLVLGDTRPELAKRILDFSFGVVSALGGTVEKLADKVFLLSHTAGGLTPAAHKQLVDAGVLRATDQQRR